MFFDNWFSLLRILIVGVLAYGALLILLRISGKRTLSKMNAFDLIVTVALGSTLATILLSEDVVLAQGVVAFGVLILLQYVIAWLSVRSTFVKNGVKSEPSLLFYQGRFLNAALRRERVTQDEVEAAVRQQGIADLEQVEAVVLETEGTVSVVKAMDGVVRSSLDSVHTVPAVPASDRPRD